MARDYFVGFNSSRVPSPCFVIDEVAIEDNLKILARVQKTSGAKVLLALKAFSMFSLAPLLSRYLNGVCASGLYESRLAHEAFEGEVHTYCVAYREQDLAEILQNSTHVIFNSFSQWERFKKTALTTQKQRPNLKFGLRINPQHSEGANTLYDPCLPASRLGIPYSEFSGKDLTGISGLHFHTLCEQGFKQIKLTIQTVEKQFGKLLHSMAWVNFGGGHLITRYDYDIDGLIQFVSNFQKHYQIQAYMEPGEAVALYSGILVAEVLDLKHNKLDLAILDTSATCHIPDVIEMPYRPEILGAAQPNIYPNTYRLGGQSCLAGDVIGDYSFRQPLKIGDRIILNEMAYYTMVKTNTFNGVPLPAIALWNSQTDDLSIVKQFSYDDFKQRLS